MSISGSPAQLQVIIHTTADSFLASYAFIPQMHLPCASKALLSKHSPADDQLSELIQQSGVLVCSGLCSDSVT